MGGKDGGEGIAGSCLKNDGQSSFMRVSMR